MTNAEIQSLLDRLAEQARCLESAYIESEGEVTDQIAALEEEQEELKTLLLEGGVDSLGRWLKLKSDEVATYKAEAAYAASKAKAAANTIDYIKYRIYELLQAAGVESVKGDLGYSFKATMSVKTETNKDILEALYNEKADKALREAGIPAYITFKLGASVSAVPEGEELPAVFSRSETPSVTFRKPRSK